MDNCNHVETSVFIPNGAMELGTWYGALCKTCHTELEARVTATGRIELRVDPKVMRKGFKVITGEAACE